MEFTNDQKKVLVLLREKLNVFITGAGGVGKSFLLEHYYKEAVEKYGNNAVHKTSTTGISAINIGGKTIHSWAGIRLGKEPTNVIIKKMFYKVKQRWKETKVLFIDEISMLHPDIFDKLNIIAKQLKKSQKPFGGIQIILSGDFFQLSPVKCEDFCFDAKSWDEVVQCTYEMKKIVRQENVEFQEMLNEIRYGQCSNNTYEKLKERVGVKLNTVIKKVDKDGNIMETSLLPTKMYPKNFAVNRLNDQELRKLIKNGSEKKNYNAEYVVHYNYSTKKNDQLISEFRELRNVEDKIELAVGTQVVFKQNISETIANGSRAVVTSFIENPDPALSKSFPIVPVVTLVSGEEKIVDPLQFEHELGEVYKVVKTQIPLKLAWACSVHGSQGSTLDLAECDIGDNIFEYGQVYVSLSRIRTLEGLSLISFNRDKIMANQKVLDKYGPGTENGKKIPKNSIKNFFKPV